LSTLTFLILDPWRFFDREDGPLLCTLRFSWSFITSESSSRELFIKAEGLVFLLGRISMLIQALPMLVSPCFLRKSTFLSKKREENFQTRRVKPGFPLRSTFVAVLLYFSAGMKSWRRDSAEIRLWLRSRTLRYSSVSRNFAKECVVYSPNLLYLR